MSTTTEKIPLEWFLGSTQIKLYSKRLEGRPLSIKKEKDFSLSDFLGSKITNKVKVLSDNFDKNTIFLRVPLLQQSLNRFVFFVQTFKKIYEIFNFSPHSNKISYITTPLNKSLLH